MITPSRDLPLVFAPPACQVGLANSSTEPAGVCTSTAARHGPAARPLVAARDHQSCPVARREVISCL